MALTTTKITDFIDTEGYANTFYGTYDHYQRIGWYFDLIVDTIEELEEDVAQKIMTGRFVLVKDEDAIFMRTSNDGEYTYTPYTIEENESEQYYVPGNTRSISTPGFKFIGYASRKAMLIFNEEGYINIDEMKAYKIADTEIVRKLSAHYFPTDYNKNYQI